jgi:hypothetical protein
MDSYVVYAEERSGSVREIDRTTNRLSAEQLCLRHNNDEMNDFCDRGVVGEHWSFIHADHWDDFKEICRLESTYDNPFA